MAKPTKDVRYEKNTGSLVPSGSGELNKQFSIPTGQEPEPASCKCGGKCNDSHGSSDSD